MPFFLPQRLVSLEYFGGEEDPEYAKLAEPYQNDIGFAFFAANFGYSKSDYESLTPRERVFILKAWENRTVLESNMFYNVVFTAVYNVFRKKNKRPLKLWHSKPPQKADMEIIRQNMQTIQEIEARDGKDWVKKIYEVNGMKPPVKG